MSTYHHQYYANFGQLGEDHEVVVGYRKTRGFPGSNEEPSEEEGFEVIFINSENIGSLMGVYNLDGPFKDDVDERVAENHGERE